MGQNQHSDVLDGLLNIIKNNVVLMTVCNEEPASYASATTQGANMLAKVAVSAGEMIISAATSGRRITIPQKTGVPVSATGGGNHVTLVESSGSGQLYYVTTATSQNLTAGNTMTINSWTITVKNVGQ